MALQDTISHNPQLPQNYHFHFVKTTSGKNERDYFSFLFCNIYIFFSEGQISLFDWNIKYNKIQKYFFSYESFEKI